MANLVGFVPYTNILDMSKLDSNDPISNKDLKEIIIQLYRILEATTLAFNTTQNAMSSFDPNRLLSTDSNGNITSNLPLFPNQVLVTDALGLPDTLALSSNKLMITDPAGLPSTLGLLQFRRLLTGDGTGLPAFTEIIGTGGTTVTWNGWGQLEIHS